MNLYTNKKKSRKNLDTYSDWTSTNSKPHHFLASNFCSVAETHILKSFKFNIYFFQGGWGGGGVGQAKLHKGIIRNKGKRVDMICKMCYFKVKGCMIKFQIRRRHCDNIHSN